MEILGVDRTSENFAGYRGTVKLTYDEVVLVCNALHHFLKNNEEIDRKDEYKKLQENWRVLETVICHGNPSLLKTTY